MKVLYVAPFRKPWVKEIPGDLESLKKQVEGSIEAIYPFDDMVAVICNEEGKLSNLMPNRILRDDKGEAYDYICGPFLVTGIGEEDFTSLTDEQVEKYTKLFMSTETLLF